MRSNSRGSYSSSEVLPSSRSGRLGGGLLSRRALLQSGGHHPRPAAIRGVFEKLFGEFAKPGASIGSKLRLVEGDYAYLVWTAENG
jgi:hypothetical protein